MIASPTPTALASPEGIWADVSIRVEIEPYDEQTDRLDAVVTISASNNTTADIVLAEAYRLPASDVAYAVAKIENTELRTTLTDSEICVYFDNRKLPAGESLTWKVTYTRMAELYFSSILAYDLFINPQRQFQGVPVQKHRFDLQIGVKTPDQAKWRAWKRWRVHQRNTRKLNPRVERASDRTVYNFGTFDLNPGQTFNLRLACVYGFTSWLAHAIELVVATAIVTLVKYLPVLVMYLRGLIL